MKLERPFKKEIHVQIKEKIEESEFLLEVEQELRQMKMWDP